MSHTQTYILRACPFCLSPDVRATERFKYNVEVWKVECSPCGAHGPIVETEEEAMKFWNAVGAKGA